jgi:hypothetical protein
MDSRLLALIGVLFLGIGIFSVILARKRLRHARALGQRAIWYKDLGLLTGFEYILLGLIVFFNLSKNWIPTQFQSTYYFFYTGTLILALVSLLTVLFLWSKQSRQNRQAAQTVSNMKADTEIQSPEERSATVQRKRERRQKAAAARRRHAGKA